MIFPLLTPALVVVLNGSVVHSYSPAYLHNGHIMAPLQPYVTAVAARIAYSGSSLVVTRGDHLAKLRFGGQAPPGQWDQTYVEIVPLLRSLGVNVAYDPQRRRLEIDTLQTMLVTPTPFNPAVPLASPAAIFTPTATATPRPQVSGSPAPRRTPLPLGCCTL
ncbi:MAG TPA: hypothetical protein VFO29_04860 [Candidatus Rubrimentiphilum sp.]|nr:hypothetical protein [Candidatus Rubrimentiphilum sp.]